MLGMLGVSSATAFFHTAWNGMERHGSAVARPDLVMRFCLVLALLLSGTLLFLPQMKQLRQQERVVLPSYMNLIIGGFGFIDDQVATPDLEPLTPETPLTVRLRRHAGLYKDKSYAPELKNILLLTASNSGYSRA
eukprot:s971_g8.t1